MDDGGGRRDEHGRMSQAGWNDLADAVLPRPVEAAHRCRVDGCRAPNLIGMGSTASMVLSAPVVRNVMGYCSWHGDLLGRYGEPGRPGWLEPLPSCGEELRPAPQSDRERGDGAEPTPAGRCEEPAVANGRCTVHLFDDDDDLVPATTYEDLLDVVRRVHGPELPAVAASRPTEDTWRVLAAVETIGRTGPTLPSFPMSDSELFGRIMVSALGGGLAGPLFEDRARTAFAMSPFALGAVLHLAPAEVDAHLRALVAAGHVQPRADHAIRQPSIAVVRTIAYPAALRRRLVRDARRECLRAGRLRDVLSAAGTVPTAGAPVHELVTDGPGRAHRWFQGTVWEPTGSGAAELRAWQERLDDRRRRDRDDGVARRLTVAAFLIAIASLVSVVADAPGAVRTVTRFVAQLVAALGG